MSKSRFNPIVDDYINHVEPFARPIVKKLRAIFLKADKRLIENVKWGVPSYEYKGIVGGFASFKHHVAWGLWKSALLKDPQGAIGLARASFMSAGKLVSVKDLPAERHLIDLIRQAVELNEKGVKVRKPKPKRRPEAKVPADIEKALGRNDKAAETFESFSPSCRREYIEWITEAKTEETREKRLLQAIEWMAQGKRRNWKYER